MMNRNERKSTSTDCDLGLGLKMQLAESTEFEKARTFPFNQYQFDTAAHNANIIPYAGGGGPSFWVISSSQACGTGYIYAPGGGGGGVAVSGRSLFTASQLQELERQQIIHKYMLASIPVPHELVLPFSRTSSLAAATQYQMRVASSSGVDPRNSSSKSDAEPWRCRRTDGKKWRCSRNVAADQRYCERHAHKNKPRSRKHVETSQFPVMTPGLGASVPYDQARRTRGGSSGTTIPISTCNYREQLHHTSSTLDFTYRDNTHHQKNVSQSQTQSNRFEFSHGEHSEMTSFHENSLVDAWEEEGIKGLSPSSLTLSMSSNRNDKGNENGHRFGIEMNDYASNSTPGGPLGEALYLGNASNSHVESPKGYTNTNNMY